MISNPTLQPFHCKILLQWRPKLFMIQISPILWFDLLVGILHKNKRAKKSFNRCFGNIPGENRMIPNSNLSAFLSHKTLEHWLFKEPFFVTSKIIFLIFFEQNFWKFKKKHFHRFSVNVPLKIAKSISFSLKFFTCSEHELSLDFWIPVFQSFWISESLLLWLCCLCFAFAGSSFSDSFLTQNDISFSFGVDITVIVAVFRENWCFLITGRLWTPSLVRKKNSALALV